MFVKCKTKGIFTLQFDLFVVQELGEAEDLEKQKKIFNGYKILDTAWCKVFKRTEWRIVFTCYLKS